MREDESNWFLRWEEQLPSPEELMPLSQTLITPDLALAFHIRSPNNQIRTNYSSQTPPPSQLLPNNSSSIGGLSAQPNNSPEFENSVDLGGSGGGGDEPARTLKRPRLVWTPQLHKRFVDAVAHLGIKNAVPKTIMQLMSVDGLTRENVASHLQKYRLYLKRLQGSSNGGGGGLASSDPAMDHLFASSPVPANFLHPGRPNVDHFSPFVSVPPLQHHHHHQQQQMAHPQHQAQYHPNRNVGHFGSPLNGHFGSSPNGQYEHPFLTRQSQQQQQQQSIHRLGTTTPLHNSSAAYLDDLNSSTSTSGVRKVLTLFPSGD